MTREVYVVYFLDYGKIPLRVFPNREAAQAWCVQHAEKDLWRKNHPRAGVIPVVASELFNLGYDIFACPMEV